MVSPELIRSAAARATALLIALVVCLGSLDLGHRGWDDPSCEPIPGSHDHNAHRFQAGRLPTAPAGDHCVLCHSLRSLRDGLIATPVAIVLVADIQILGPIRPVLADPVPASAAPSRAPPLASL